MKKKKDNKLPEENPSSPYSIFFHRFEGESDHEMAERTALAGLIIGLLGSNGGSFTLRSGPYRKVYCQPDKYVIEKRDGTEFRLNTMPASELKLIISHYGLENPERFSGFVERMVNTIENYKEQSKAN